MCGGILFNFKSIIQPLYLSYAETYNTRRKLVSAKGVPSTAGASEQQTYPILVYGIESDFLVH